jgi:hypothetical protein
MLTINDWMLEGSQLRDILWSHFEFFTFLVNYA